MIALHSFFAEAVAVGEIALGEMSGSETEIEVQEIRCTPLGDFAEQGLRLSEDLVAGVIGRLEGGTPGSIQVVMEPEDALVWAQIGSVDDPVERFVALGTAVLEGIATGFSEILERVVSLSDPKLVEDAELTTAWVVEHAVPLLTDPSRLSAMSAAAASLVPRDADEALARIVVQAAGRSA